MKKYIAAAILFAAFGTACTINMGSQANNGGSPSNSSSSAPGKTEKTSAADTTKNDTATKPSSSADSGGKGERIEFAPGKIETSLTREIPANGSIDFLLNAKSGQRLQYSVIFDDGAETDVEVVLTEPGSQDITISSPANQNNEFMIKKSGDHRITVNNLTGSKISVNFGVWIK